MRRVEGYDDRTYGRGFADVYDDWYHGISEIGATVAALTRLAGGGPVLELGIGTGRLAIPLALDDPDLVVVGIDSSPEMLGRLAERTPPSNLTTVLGDMVADIPVGPYSLVFVAYNTLFNLVSAARQRQCFDAVARRLTPGGRFVVEAFVPDDPPRDGDLVEIRSLAADRVVLSLSRHHAADQRAEGQFIELTEAGGVRLRPWSIRYATPSELDDMATAAGLRLESRSETFEGGAWQPDSPRHVSVYRRDG